MHAERPTITTADRPVTSDRQASFTVPGLSIEQGARVADCLQERLVALSDLSQTLKHIHWNVVGPHFIAVHEMLDPQYHAATAMIDELAERIATLGGVPSTLPRRSDDVREWNDYSLDRADSLAHLGALDMVFVGVVTGHRDAVDLVGEIDLISQDLLVGQTRQLERFHWFVRSHLADWAGGMANAGSTTELGAARSVAAKSRRQRKA
ncbi:MAG: DNA starvation/stationary phase protection protein [Actinomycetota bacterium]|nr:DNA starvation/stationary phase protection protein [Actinomycetota bacterium]